MCGIIGYVGSDRALPILRTGLENLEYRGYDSAGIAFRSPTELRVFKQAGRIDDLVLPDEDEEDATCGVGHTRWSTHGEPTDENAHPHTDEGASVAVVHNGIVENYDRLREELAAHTFTSETDTEVIPHLLELELEAGYSLPDAVERVIDKLEGAFAFVAVSPTFDGLVAARQDNPLVVGHGETGNFVASDVTAFLEHTRDVSYLEDGDVAIVTESGIEVRNDGARVDRDVERVEWEAEAAEKSGYEHYMLKEIHEQPKALRQCLSGRIDELEGDVALDLELELPTEYLNSLEEVTFVACGTSYHAGMYAARLLEEYADVRASAEIASEYEFDGGRDPWRTLVVAVTQSGETADTLRALRRATHAGARTLAVTNTLGSTVTRETDDTVFIRAGPEIGVAATKTFVSQVATLTLVAVHLARARGTLSTTDAIELLSSVRRLPGAIQEVLNEEETIREAALEYVDGDAFFFIGRHLGYPVALEGALKLKEIAYVHAEGFAAGELKHGPLALVTSKTPVLATLSEGTRPSETLNNVKEVESRGAPVLGCTSVGRAEKYLDVGFEVPELGPLSPLVANVYYQLFAYHVANEMGRSIDKPRNLAKSVTVE